MSRRNLPMNLGSISSQQVAAAIVESAGKFWAAAAADRRLKLEEARHISWSATDPAALAAAGHAPLSPDLATRLAIRFHAYREEEMFVFPGAHERDRRAEGPRGEAGAGDQRRRRPAARQGRTFRALCTGSITSRSKASTVSANQRARLSARDAGARHHRDRDLDDRRQSGMGSRRGRGGASASTRSGSTCTATACQRFDD